MVEFGVWSTSLAILAAQVALLAAAVVSGRENRDANRFLAALLLVIASMIVPFSLGYAGFYDAYPWLTSAPFSIPLAVGPLAYLYVRSLAGRLGRWRGHLILPATQFGYQSVLFLFPTEGKWWWDENVHEPFISPPLTVVLLLSMTAYAVATWRELRRYEDWLTARRRSPAPVKRLRSGLLVLAVLLVCTAGYELFNAVIRPTNYFDLFGFYILLGVLGIYLGLNGWRNSEVAVPAIMDVPEPDWSAKGAQWVLQLRQGNWWRDPSLDLARLAALLGTNTTHLSRALNAHCGGFADALATLRAEAVASEIDGGCKADLLTMALDAGFGSKASFNRAFRARFGTTPSAYRDERRRLTP